MSDRPPVGHTSEVCSNPTCARHSRLRIHGMLQFGGRLGEQGGRHGGWHGGRRGGRHGSQHIMLQFGERVGHSSWLIGPKSVFSYPTCVSSKLCEFILEEFFVGQFFDGKFLVEKGWKIFGWKLLVKIFGGKYSVETCQWKIFGRKGGDQLTEGLHECYAFETTLFIMRHWDSLRGCS